MLLKSLTKNYSQEIIVFVATLILLSTTFFVNEIIGARASKVYWFYTFIPWISLVLLPLAWKRPMRLTNTDIIVLLYMLYSLFNVYYSEAVKPQRVGLLMTTGATYFLFRRLITTMPSHGMNIALLVVGLAEALHGIAQIYGLTSSHHNNFVITGSFFNPGPYSGFVVTILPLALHYALNSKETLRILAIVVMIAIMLVLPATMSRGSWLAALAGIGIVLGNRYQCCHFVTAFYRKRPASCAALSLLVALLIVLLAIAIYTLKKDSADGRLLIWKVSTTIIASHPLTGIGFGNFAGPYGEAQAAYFSREDHDPREELVADAPEFAFNEFIQITVENGIIGLLLFLGIIISALVQAFRSNVRERAGFIGSLIAFLVFSCFSYPFGVLPLAIIFTLIIAQCTSSDLPPAPQWVIRSLYIALLIPVFYYTSGHKSRKEALKRWKNEQIYYNMQIYERTVDNYEDLYPTLCDQPAFLFEYAQCLVHTNNPSQSIRVLIEASKLSSDPMIHNIIGKNYQALKQYTLAEASFIKASQMVPNRLYPHYLLAKMYFESGQMEKAAATAMLVLEKIPKVTSSATEEMKREMQLLLRDPRLADKSTHRYTD